MAIFGTTTRVAVTAGSTTLHTAVAGARNPTIINTGTTNVFLATGANVAAAATGFLLAPGAQLTLQGADVTMQGIGTVGGSVEVGYASVLAVD
jgi:hypothetical protein